MICKDCGKFVSVKAGKISADMCHPFEVYKGLVFTHNGIIFGNEYKSELVSDTYLYNKKVFKKLPKKFYLSKGIINLIKKRCRRL